MLGIGLFPAWKYSAVIEVTSRFQLQVLQVLEAMLLLMLDFFRLLVCSFKSGPLMQAFRLLSQGHLGTKVISMSSKLPESEATCTPNLEHRDRVKLWGKCKKGSPKVTQLGTAEHKCLSGSCRAYAQKSLQNKHSSPTTSGQQSYGQWMALNQLQSQNERAAKRKGEGKETGSMYTHRHARFPFPHDNALLAVKHAFRVHHSPVRKSMSCISPMWCSYICAWN